MRVSNPIANSYTKNQANNKFVTVNLEDTEPGTPEKDKAIQLPIGFIFEWSPVPDSDIDLSTSQKVEDYFGYGTWTAFGAGQFLLGVGNEYLIGNTGGEAKHTLARDELPNEKIYINVAIPDSPETGAEYARFQYSGYTSKNDAVTLAAGFSEPLGSGLSHNNMPPYIVVYRWQRTA